MAGGTEQIIVEYIAQVEGFKAQLKTMQTELKNVQKGAEEAGKKTEESFSSAGEHIKDVAKDIALSLGIAFSVEKIVEFGKESVLAFASAEAASKKLEFAVTRIGGEGKIAFEKLIELTETLSKKSIFSADSIKKSELLLSQFGLQSKQIEKLLPQIIDFASATGQDLAAATETAIQGINGVGRGLKQYGIVLSDTGSKTENLSKLQEQLGKFAGSAGVAMETTAGKLQIADNRFEEFKEGVGEYLTKFAGDIIETVDNLGSAFEKTAPKITSTAEQIEKLNKLAPKIAIALAESQRAAVDAAGGSADAYEKLNKRIEESNKKLEEQKVEDANKAQKIANDLTAKGLAEAEAARKKAADDFVKGEKQKWEDAIQESDRLMDIDLKHQEQADELKKKLDKDVWEAEKKGQEDAIAEASRLYDEDVANKKKAEEEKKRAAEEVRKAEFELAVTIIDAIFDHEREVNDMRIQQKQEAADQQIQQNQDVVDQQRQQIDDQLAAGVITQQQAADQKKLIEQNLANATKGIQAGLQAEKRKAAHDQAIRDKEQALFNIAIATAKGIAESLPNVPLSIIVGAIGAVQAAAVLAKPVPQFAKGVIDLQGGVEGRDSIPAILMPHESVMTADETRDHGDLLRSIRSKKLDEYLLDNYLNPRLSEILNGSTAENMAKNAALNGIDEYSLARLMSRNTGVHIKNADQLAKAIAREMKTNEVKRLWSD